LKEKKAIAIAIIESLAPDKRIQYSVLKALAESKPVIESKTISHESYARHLRMLVNKGIIMREERKRDEVFYSMSEGGKRLHKLGLVGSKFSENRRRFFRILIMADAENRIAPSNDRKPGFLSVQAFDRVLERDFGYSDWEATDIEIAGLLKLSTEEGLLRIQEMDTEGPSYVIADDLLREYLRKLWFIFTLQFQVRVEEWEYTRRTTREERKKLEDIFGKAAAKYYEAYCAELRKRSMNADGKGRTVPDALRVKEDWNRKIAANAVVLNEAYNHLRTKYDFLPDLTNHVLFENIVVAEDRSVTEFKTLA
jgi:hypothetical protein